MNGFATLNAFLISVVLMMAGSCSSTRSENAPPSSPQATPTPEREERGGITVVHFANEPFALLRVEVDVKSTQMTLEIQNVSNKTVRLVTYGLGVSTRCSEFMYSMIPSPRIGYGDWSAAGIKVPDHADATLKPQEKATIVVARDKYLLELLNAKTYHSCPDGHKKPELMLQNVYFDDGTEWRPNQAR